MSTTRCATRCAGQAIACVLAGCWRVSPPKVSIPPNEDELETVIPLLLWSGAGALAWRQLRHTNLPPSVLAELHAAYVGYAIEAAKHEAAIAHTFQILRAGGVDPILIKGWAAGRLYPESGLRPSGDIDLCISPLELPTAESLLGNPELVEYHIDVKHTEIDRFSEVTFSELYAHSELVPLLDTSVRVLGPEDHLRVLCLHLIKHGAWRPLWLCDVAVSLEHLPSAFDWDRCLGRNLRHARWVKCVLGLACVLLHANRDAVPSLPQLPRWLVPAVLKQWGKNYDSKPPLLREQIRENRIGQTLHLLHERWRNPIQATVDADGRFNNWPRFPYQMRDYMLRTARFLPHLVTAPAAALKSKTN